MTRPGDSRVLQLAANWVRELLEVQQEVYSQSGNVAAEF